MTSSQTIWAILPAAGIGRRMQSSLPKQYLPLCGRTIIEHTIDALLCIDRVAGIVIALQPNDPHWASLGYSGSKPVLIADGGTERCHSVLSAIELLLERTGEESAPWALVHDAVRPCISEVDINRLIDEATADENGGLLAMPVRDTIKRQSRDLSVAETVDRTGLWHALTPQLFRARQLRHALINAIRDEIEVTDEASAMEHAGYTPRLVEGAGSNIKITRPDDLKIAQLLLGCDDG